MTNMCENKIAIKIHLERYLTQLIVFSLYCAFDTWIINILDRMIEDI